MKTLGASEKKKEGRKEEKERRGVKQKEEKEGVEFERFKRSGAPSWNASIGSSPRVESLRPFVSSREDNNSEATLNTVITMVFR